MKCEKKIEIRLNGEKVADAKSELEAYEWIQINTPYSLAQALTRAGYVIVNIDELEKWLNRDDLDD